MGEYSLMIQDVQVKKLVKHVDDRGFFMEILRDDDQLLTKFGQFSMSMTYPGVIKAFHYHKLQDDLWFFPVGNDQVVLYDMRDDSPTKGETNVFYMGEHNPILLYIPIGVAHGYRVLGDTPAVITYVTTMSYQSGQPDEYRIAWDDPEIGFDWETKNR
jgi:dTDP-4-dehydrorhamnose 3,5-epimerase